MPPYKKLQTLISAFIKNLIFGKNRDPCCQKDHFGGAGHSKSCATQETFCDGSLDQGEVGVGYSSQQLEEEEMGGIPIFRRDPLPHQTNNGREKSAPPSRREQVWSKVHGAESKAPWAHSLLGWHQRFWQVCLLLPQDKGNNEFCPLRLSPKEGTEVVETGEAHTGARLLLSPHLQIHLCFPWQGESQSEDDSWQFPWHDANWKYVWTNEATAGKRAN